MKNDVAMLQDIPEWVELDATSLRLKEIPSIEQLSDFIPKLATMKSAMPFWVGDLCNDGEESFGEAFSQVVDLFGEYSYNAVANNKSVCKRVERERRRPELSFSHHAVVAKLPAVEQIHWLEIAVSDPESDHRMLTSTELAERINPDKKKKKSFVERAQKMITDLANLAELAPNPKVREHVLLAVDAIKDAREIAKEFEPNKPPKAKKAEKKKQAA